MEKKVRVIEFRTGEGKVIFRLYMFDGEIALKDEAEREPDLLKEGTKEERPSDSGPKTDESLMTNAQKRFLFRILAEQGMEGEKAHKHLKGLFQVNSLKG